MESACVVCVRKARVRVGWIRNVTGYTKSSYVSNTLHPVPLKASTTPLLSAGPPSLLTHFTPLTHGHEGELKTTLDSLSEYLIREVGKADIRGPRLVLDRMQKINGQMSTPKLFPTRSWGPT